MNHDLRQFVESTIQLPLAMAVFGLEQGATALMEQSGETQLNRALYLASQAAQKNLGGVLQGAFEIGDSLQREFVDAAFRLFLHREPSCPHTATSVETLWQLLALEGKTGVASTNWQLAIQELRNKLEVYELVKQSRAALHEPSASEPPVRSLLDRARSLPVYERVWAIEGLGHDYAKSLCAQGKEQGILTTGSAVALPAESLTMMHAGMGLAFAENLWDGITPFDDIGKIHAAVQSFASLCQVNAVPGYTGAAYESLGLVTRTFHPLMVHLASLAIAGHFPALYGYFWHGVGRALYFCPTHFVPGLTSPWAGVMHSAPDREALCNLISGLAWATSLVNVRQPEIVANLLTALGHPILKGGAFSSGLSSVMLMAREVVPENPWIGKFFQYIPDEPETSMCWDEYVRKPYLAALSRLYPVIKQDGVWERLFQCDLKGQA